MDATSEVASPLPAHLAFSRPKLGLLKDKISKKEGGWCLAMTEVIIKNIGWK